MLNKIDRIFKKINKITSYFYFSSIDTVDIILEDLLLK